MEADLSDVKTPDMIQELWRRYPEGFVCAFNYMDDGGDKKTAFASSGDSTAMLGITRKLQLQFDRQFLAAEDEGEDRIGG